MSPVGAESGLGPRWPPFHVVRLITVLIVLPLAVRLLASDHNGSSLRLIQGTGPGPRQLEVGDTLGPRFPGSPTRSMVCSRFASSLAACCVLAFVLDG